MTDHAHTMLILTDAESRLIRKALGDHPDVAGPLSSAPGCQAVQAFNRGITRGTAKMAEDFAERQRAKKSAK